MAEIQTPQAMRWARDGDQAVLIIEGVGAMHMPRDAAHACAQQAMQVVGEIDALAPKIILPNTRSWPRH